MTLNSGDNDLHVRSLKRLAELSERTESHQLLLMTLELAVFLWVPKIRGMSESVRLDRGEKCLQMIAEHGDDVLRRSDRPGGTAIAFNALAEGLAHLAFRPGGVDFGVLHFDAAEQVAEQATEAEPTTTTATAAKPS